jgi:hypothetical protein
MARRGRDVNTYSISDGTPTAGKLISNKVFPWDQSIAFQCLDVKVPDGISLTG